MLKKRKTTSAFQILLKHATQVAVAFCHPSLALKAYPQISYRGRFQNLNFLYLFVAHLQEAHFPKRLKQKSFPYEMRAILSIKSRRRDLI